MQNRRFAGAAAAPMVFAAALALSLTACSDDATSSSTAPGSATTGAESVAPNSEAGLRTELGEFYAIVAQQRQWAEAHSYLSPRCQNKVGAADLAAAMEDKYGPGSGRDFSGLPEYKITMKGDEATVVQKPYDDKGVTTTQTWAFIDGRWALDSC